MRDRSGYYFLSGKKKLSWQNFKSATDANRRIDRLIFLMIMGAMIFSSFLTATEVDENCTLD